MLSELERIADHSVNIAYSMSDEDEDEILAAENEALTAKIKFELNLEYKKGSANPFDTLCIFDLQILFPFFLL